MAQVEQSAIHCFYHPAAPLTSAEQKIPKFAQTFNHTHRIELRCSVEACPFVASVEEDQVRRCKYCGKELMIESVTDSRCNQCKRERQKLLDSL